MEYINTKGIVLSTMKYKESSVISRIYTEKLGLRSYLVHGVRSSRNRKTQKAALFQPLNLLDLQVTERPLKELQQIKGGNILYPMLDCRTNIIKGSILLFLTEVLSKVLKEEQENPTLFLYLQQSLIIFDKLQKHFANFHLQFLLNLPDYLGLTINEAKSLYTEQRIHDHPELDKTINQLLQTPFDEYIPLNQQQRSEVLDHIIRFYQYHFQSFDYPKSLEILKEVLSA
ncbi:DNA repair protein RecO [Algivirga pacifica]|uniref:DNA repair protein RecO n=1 Tax=Algivirga pacifica TaxID=1162670 RepID=A0ABP9DL03_9BACT